VAKRIAQLKVEDPELSWSDIAILSRSNDGAEPFITALDRQGIPFRFYALRGLYAKPIVVDLTAMMSLCDGFHESPAVWRVLSSASYAFPIREIQNFVQFAAKKKGMSLWSAVISAHAIPGIDPEIARRAEVFHTDFEKLAEAARRETPLRMLQLILDKTGMLGQVMKLPEGEKIESINYLNGFADRIKRYEQSTLAPTLKGFMEEFRIEIDSGEEGGLNADPNEGPELVKVLTVHASKGLEFKHVFIVSMVDQRFPSRPRSESIPLPDGLVNERLPEGDSHLEEERRLFYVAVTRAKDTVTLTGAEQYGGTKKKKPSIFLAEVGIDAAALRVTEGAHLLTLAPPMQVHLEELWTDEEQLPLKRRFSFTQLAAFRSCPLQYKFAHIYKIPILGSYQKSFGQCMHLTLQDVLTLHAERGKAQQGDLFDAGMGDGLASPGTVGMPETGMPPGTVGMPDSTNMTDRARPSLRPYDGGFRVTLPEALEIFEQRWGEHDDWYETQGRYDEYHAQGSSSVTEMMRRWAQKVPDVAFLERPFDWRIGEHSLKGKIDRIDRKPDGTFEIVDYKTGKPKTEEDIVKKDKEQLWIYQIAMEEMGMSITSLKYVYLLNGEAVDVEILQGEKRDVFREDVAGLMKEILLSRFTPTPSPFICRYCDFRSICEYRKI
jgi:DNA helicase-2/ATP-dependent DNA helicase PcrA